MKKTKVYFQHWYVSGLWFELETKIYYLWNLITDKGDDITYVFDKESCKLEVCQMEIK